MDTIVPERPVPAEIRTNLQRWDRLAAALRFLFILLAVSASAGSLIVTSFTQELSSMKGGIPLKAVSFLSALSIGLLTGLDVAGKANRVRRAARMLTAAIIRYREEPHFEMEALIRAYEGAQDLVGDVNYIPQHTQADEAAARRGGPQEDRLSDAAPRPDKG